MPRNPDRNQKISRAATARREQRARRLTVGDYALYRFDVHNWAVEPVPCRDEDRRRYYPRLADALRALLHLQFEQQADQALTLADLLDGIQRAENAVTEALRAHAPTRNKYQVGI